MKPFPLLLTASLLLALAAPAWTQVEEAPPEAKPDPNEFKLPEIEYPEPTTKEQKKAAGRHTNGSQKLAVEQDELAADVQDLIEEQTNEKVIQLLEQVEEIMGEVIGALDQTETGGKTIAAETEIIEKIFEAAQQRAQQSGGKPQEGGMSMGAMLDMMQRMMGKEPGQGQQPGQGKGQGQTGGEGQTGESDAPNKNLAEAGQGKKEPRRIGKSAGKAGTHLPLEFQKALEAYNKSR